MGWFDEQIRQRMRGDDERLSDAFFDLSSVITGRKAAASDHDGQTRAAFDEILRFFHAKRREVPDDITDPGERLEYLLRPTGIMRRTVRLTPGWHRTAIGAMLGKTDSGAVVALLPNGLSGYTYFDYEENKRVRVDKRTAGSIAEEAVCFYRPLPLKKLGILELMRFIVSNLSVWDVALAVLATLAVTLLGLLGPYVNGLIFSAVVPSGEMRLLVPIACLLVGVTLSTELISLTKSAILNRISTKTDTAVEAAAMMRTLSLPARFFQDYSAGELDNRISSMNTLCSMLSDAVLTTGLSSLFSLVYIGQIFRYARALVLPALSVVIVTAAVSLLSTLAQMKISERRMQLSARESGLVYALISGVQKLKNAGAEKRAFAKWASVYAEAAKLEYDPPAFLKFNGALTTAVSLFGVIAIYYFAATAGISIADYMAFSVCYGMVTGAFAQLSSVALTAANIRPVLNLVKPILTATPEISEQKKMVRRLSGALELNNVSFSYGEGKPLVLDDLTLKIRPGQYVAVVGRTGCGKSTLIRLLLGFETPQKGAVYYDGQDVQTLDLRSLRRNIGVALQDGKLFPGDIYSNITISAPELTVAEAWEAARLAGVDEDIRALPMGMFTLLSGGSGGISGGQAQRLMIARAIAPKPKILIFDEATSALDNITQRRVTEALDGLKCTRIVVAHRLSTIMSCNRIVVLEGGHIVQDGTYEELVKEKSGLFYELVRRQQVEKEPVA